MVDIKGFEGKYAIEKDGRIWSYYREWHTGKKVMSKPARWVKSYIGQNGYPHITLTDLKGNNRGYSIHRLLAQAYIPNPEGKKCVNHINGVKTDNRLDNLEWATYSENTQHAMRTGLMNTMGDRSYKAKLTKKDVIDIRRMNIVEGVSQAEIGRMYGLTKGTIRHLVVGITWRHVREYQDKYIGVN